eukprot:1153854-Lingulodinium_polyedra.AAC.1
MSNGFPWLPLVPDPVAPPSTPRASLSSRAGTSPTALCTNSMAGRAAGACPTPWRAGAGPAS